MILRGIFGIKGHVAFYADKMDGCFVNEEKVTPQPGGMYGGWITSDLAGPFKVCQAAGDGNISKRPLGGPLRFNTVLIHKTILYN